MEIVYASPSDDPRAAESRCVIRVSRTHVDTNLRQPESKEAAGLIVHSEIGMMAVTTAGDVEVVAAEAVAGGAEDSITTTTGMIAESSEIVTAKTTARLRTSLGVNSVRTTSTQVTRAVMGDLLAPVTVLFLAMGTVDPRLHLRLPPQR